MKSPGTDTSSDRLQLMETFVRIVDAGSLSAAAAQLQSTQPTISRRLKSLEESLGVRLLQRSTHAMRMTVDGERCYDGAKELLANWAAFEASIRGDQEEPEGTLRVAMPHAFGQDRFVIPLAEYLNANPRANVEWRLQDVVRDFIGSGIDCAVQVGEPHDPSVVAIKLAEIPRMVAAAPSVIEGKRSSNIEDLASLPWLALQTYYRNEVVLTHYKTGKTARIAINPRLSTDSLFALRSAAVMGLGACLGSAWLLEQDIAAGKLVQLAPQWQPAALPVYLIYPYARYYPSRLLRFIDTMK